MASPASIPSSFATLPEEKLAQCCFPNSACLIGTLVDVTNESSSVQPNNGSSANRMYCTNTLCDQQQSRYIHTHCLEQLENQLTQKAKKVAAESKDGSLKGLSDKQVRQNIWNLKPSLEQIYSSLNCQCGKGHLTRDPSVTSGGGDPASMEAPFQIVQSSNKRGGGGGNKKRGFAASSAAGGSNTSQSRQGAKVQGAYSPAKITQNVAPQSKQISRIRNSLSASDMTSSAGGGVGGHPGGGTASSSPGGAGGSHLAHSPDSMSPRSAGSSSHLSSNKWPPPGHSSSPPTSGRLNRRVDHTSIQAALDPYRYNIYHVRTEDDLPSDEHKEAFFQTLRNRSLNVMNCVLCNKRLNVYDRYPLIDGCIFISPIKHHPDDRCLPFASNNSAKHMFVSCVCIRCLQGGNSVICACTHCGREWVGVAFQIGVIYPFDIFAPNVCCSERSKCSQCEKQLVSSTRPLPQRYPEFSQLFACPSCHEVDCHFVKPVQHIFRIQHNPSAGNNQNQPPSITSNAPAPTATAIQQY